MEILGKFQNQIHMEWQCNGNEMGPINDKTILKIQFSNYLSWESFYALVLRVIT